MASLNYKHLGYFRAVARAGNLTRAAEALNLSQSALSVQIRKLEEMLGHDLFERRGRGLHLTEAGRIALDHAESIFQTGEELLGTLTNAVEARPILRVGALATLSRNFQIDFLRPVLAVEDVQVVLRSGRNESLLEDLRAMRLDVVLSNAAMIDDGPAPYRSHRLAEQQVSLIGPASFGQVEDIASLLSAQPVVLPSPGTSIRAGFDAMVQRLEVRPRIIAEADDMAMLRLLAREGVGIAVLPPVVVRDELAAGTLAELSPLPGVSEAFYAITLERRFPNPLLETVLRGVS